MSDHYLNALTDIAVEKSFEKVTSGTFRSYAEMRATYSTKLHVTALTHYANGLSVDEIAKELHRSPRTIENYFQKMREVLDCKNITHLVATALRLKIIE